MGFRQDWELRAKVLTLLDEIIIPRGEKRDFCCVVFLVFDCVFYFVSVVVIFIFLRLVVVCCGVLFLPALAVWCPCFRGLGCHDRKPTSLVYGIFANQKLFV